MSKKVAIAVLSLIFVLIVSIAATIVLSVKLNEGVELTKNEFTKTESQLQKYQELLKTTKTEVKDLESGNDELLLDLYITVKKEMYSKGDVAKKLFKEIFPKDSTFKGDMDNGRIALYAMIQNHSEIMFSEKVLQCIQAIDINRVELKDAVELYNMYIDLYNFWLTDYENYPDYCEKSTSYYGVDLSRMAIVEL